MDPKWMRFYAIMTTAAVMKAILVFGGYFLGAALDKRFGTSPFLAFTFLIAGGALGIWWVMMVVKRTRM